tara:strand:- start:16266 stop:17111 length:846 start_codon:yes stop_codon:yes gene_type:complete
MKKIIIPFILVVALVFQSCEETQSPIYDGSQTLAYFDGTSARIEVEINTTSTITVPVGVSTLSTSDRTMIVSAVASSTTATASQYSFDGTVTIPANSYSASFSVTGIDDGLETTGVNLTLQIDSVDGGSPSPRTYEITLIEVCPIPDTYFLGDYRIDQLSGTGPFASLASVFGSQVVTVSGTGTTREFDFAYAPTTFASDFAMTIQLVCNTFNFEGRIQSGSLSCDGGATQIGQGNGTVPSLYDVNDDSFFTMTIADFEGPGFDGGCGASPYDAVITMTKL